MNTYPGRVCSLQFLAGQMSSRYCLWLWSVIALSSCCQIQTYRSLPTTHNLKGHFNLYAKIGYLVTQLKTHLEKRRIQKMSHQNHCSYHLQRVRFWAENILQTLVLVQQSVHILIIKKHFSEATVLKHPEEKWREKTRAAGHSQLVPRRGQECTGHSGNLPSSRKETLVYSAVTQIMRRNLGGMKTGLTQSKKTCSRDKQAEVWDYRLRRLLPFSLPGSNRSSWE